MGWLEDTFGDLGGGIENVWDATAGQIVDPIWQAGEDVVGGIVGGIGDIFSGDALGGSTSASQSHQDVWGGQSPYLEDYYSRVAQMYGDVGQGMPANPYEDWLGYTTGEHMLRDYAGSDQLSDMLSQSTGAWGQALSVDPSQNPYFQSAYDAATQPLIQQFQEEILPSIGSSALSAGGYGGTRQGLAEGRAAEGLVRTLGDIGSTMGMDAYTQGLRSRMSALGMTPQMATLGTLPSRYMTGTEQDLLGRQLGGYQVGMQQYGIPWQQMSQIGSMFGGPTVLSTSTSTGEQQQGWLDPAMDIAGAAILADW